MVQRLPDLTRQVENFRFTRSVARAVVAMARADDGAGNGAHIVKELFGDDRQASTSSRKGRWSRPPLPASLRSIKTISPIRFRCSGRTQPAAIFSRCLGVSLDDSWGLMIPTITRQAAASASSRKVRQFRSSSLPSAARP